MGSQSMMSEAKRNSIIKWLDDMIKFQKRALHGPEGLCNISEYEEAVIHVRWQNLITISRALDTPVTVDFWGHKDMTYRQFIIYRGVMFFSLLPNNRVDEMRKILGDYFKIVD